MESKVKMDEIKIGIIKKGMDIDLIAPPDVITKCSKERDENLNQRLYDNRMIDVGCW